MVVKILSRGELIKKSICKEENGASNNNQPAPCSNTFRRSVITTHRHRNRKMPTHQSVVCIIESGIMHERIHLPCERTRITHGLPSL